jgi:universal stress protein A
MIEHLETSADGRAMRFRAGGKLTHEDYQNLIPQLEKAISEHGKISILVELEEISGIEPRAILDEFAFDIRHFRDFDRLGVVGEQEWEDWMTRVTNPLTPGEMRYFNSGEAQAAWTWVQGG